MNWYLVFLTLDEEDRRNRHVSQWRSWRRIGMPDEFKEMAEREGRLETHLKDYFVNRPNLGNLTHDEVKRAKLIFIKEEVTG